MENRFLTILGQNHISALAGAFGVKKNEKVCARSSIFKISISKKLENPEPFVRSEAQAFKKKPTNEIIAGSNVRWAYYLLFKKKREFLQTVEYEFFGSKNTAFTVTMYGSRRGGSLPEALEITHKWNK